MAFNKGAGATCAIGKESAWGTAVADTLLLNFASETLGVNPKKVEEESLLASKAKAALDLMALSASGDVVLILKPENAGFIMKAALGGTDTVTNPSGQYLHTIPAQSATGSIPSYTIFVNRKQAIKKYSGSKVASLKLSAKVGDYVRATVSWKCKDEAAGTIATSAVPSKKAYKMIGATLTVGGVAMEITSVDLGIDNQLDDGLQTNVSGLYITEPVHGQRVITISWEMPDCAASQTLRDTNFLAETVVASIVLHLESPEIITGAYKYRMDITLNNVAITEAKVNVSGKDIITMSCAGEATAVGSTEPISAAIYDNASAAY